jgi:hypothetical protein
MVSTCTIAASTEKRPLPQRCALLARRNRVNARTTEARTPRPGKRAPAAMTALPYAASSPALTVTVPGLAGPGA